MSGTRPRCYCHRARRASLYETVGYGREPLYDYVVRVGHADLCENYLTLRIVSALAGLLLIVVMHFWVRRAFDVPTAMATSAFLATSLWPSWSAGRPCAQLFCLC